MHKLTFFPLGNADCTRIVLDNGKRILFDFGDMRDRDDPKDKRCDLQKEIREDLKAAGRDYIDVVAFTHLDADHFRRSTDFFHLEHAKKYQGGDRIKMNVMWVPAAIITEQAPDDEEARVLQKEARHRFKEGKWIRVFSRPERLREWCKENSVDFESRRSLITDAGQVAPEISLKDDEAEFFVHSPFGRRQDENTVEDRNGDALVMQLVLASGGVQTKVLLLADADHEVLGEIVTVTRGHKRDVRLEWDVAKLPHHCSYLSIGPDKGKDKTKPTKEVAWLYEDKGLDRPIAVSSSCPIPAKGTAEDEDVQPPHRQAAAYYQEVTGSKTGQFVVTMENPNAASPEPVVIEVDASKATLRKRAVAAAVFATTRSAPRAG